MIGTIREVSRLSQSKSSGVLWASVLWRAAASFFGIAPYLALYVTLVALFDGTLTYTFLAAATSALLVATLLEIGCSYKAEHAGFSGGVQMMSDLRLATADHLRALPLGWFTRQQSGRLAQTLSENIQMAEELITHLASAIIGNLAIAALIAVILLWTDPLLGVAALLSAPLAIFVMRGIRGYFDRLSSGRVQETGETASRFLEYIQGIKVIRSFGLMGDRFSALETSLRRLTNTSIKLETAGSMALMAFAAILEFGFLVILVGGSYLFLGGDLTAPALLLFLILSHRFYGPLTETAAMLAESRYIEKCLSTVKNILDVPALPETDASATLKGFDLQLDRISFRYPEAEENALSNITCTIPEGSLTAIVGPSGSGKTSLVHLIARFHDVACGQIRLGGTDIRDIPTPDFLGAMSFVFQDVYLFQDSVAANIRIGIAEASDEEVIEAAKLARAHDFIENLPEGYDTVIGDAGATLSSGERQRLSIARALLKKAPILILDEATASLDPENEAEMQSGLSELIKGKTVIVIAHRLGSIVGADQILVLDQGRLDDSGTHVDLVDAGGLYATLWNEQERAAAFQF